MYYWEYEERGSHLSGPAGRNELPTDTHYINNTELFKKHLNAVLFDHAYC